jgi:hypothetical protein
VRKPQTPGLRRQIGLVTATALVVGEVTGVRIFLTPAGMLESLGSPAGVPNSLAMSWGSFVAWSSPVARAVCFPLLV